jgi:hypothetical protein
MAKDPTYKDFKKTLRRLHWAIWAIKLTVYPIIWLMTIDKAIKQSRGLQITAAVLRAFFEVVFGFIAAHVLIVVFFFLLPLAMLEAFTNVMLTETYKTAYFYWYWNKQLSDPISEYRLIKLQIGVERSVRMSRRNFKRVKL